MKKTLIALLSLLCFVSKAQSIDVPAEIARAGKQMLVHHSAVWADTCIKKIDLMAAKRYADDLENRYDKTLQDNALLRFQIDQRAQRIEAIGDDNDRLTAENTGLKTEAEEMRREIRIGGWVKATLGAAVGALTVFLATQ